MPANNLSGISGEIRRLELKWRSLDFHCGNLFGRDVDVETEVGQSSLSVGQQLVDVEE